MRDRAEGAADGGVVVQDCLQLLQSLLRRNGSNQRMFRCGQSPECYLSLPAACACKLG